MCWLFSFHWHTCRFRHAQRLRVKCTQQAHYAIPRVSPGPLLEGSVPTPFPSNLSGRRESQALAITEGRLTPSRAGLRKIALKEAMTMRITGFHQQSPSQSERALQPRIINRSSTGSFSCINRHTAVTAARTWPSRKNGTIESLGPDAAGQG